MPDEKPTLSHDLVAYNESLLNDAAWVSRYPKHAAMVRQTLDDAKKLSGYQSPPKDQRTPEQRTWDERHGVHDFAPEAYTLPTATETFNPASIVAAFSASSVDPLLGNAIFRELAEEPVTNPAATRARIEATGRNWDDVVKDASYVLGKTAGRLRPEQLSARSLVMLAVHGDMMRRHLVGRPTAKK